MQLTAGELNELLADVADVPGERDGFTLVASVPLDFSLSTAYTARIMGGFSAYRKRGWRKVAQKRNPLPGSRCSYCANCRGGRDVPDVFL